VTRVPAICRYGQPAVPAHGERRVCGQPHLYGVSEMSRLLQRTRGRLHQRRSWRAQLWSCQVGNGRLLNSFFLGNTQNLHSVGLLVLPFQQHISSPCNKDFR